MKLIAKHRLEKTSGNTMNYIPIHEMEFKSTEFAKY